MHLNSFSVSTMLSGVSDLGESVPVMSSKVAADQGTDWMRQNIILSGPLEVPEWTQQKGHLPSRLCPLREGGRRHPLEHPVRL